MSQLITQKRIFALLILVGVITAVGLLSYRFGREAGSKPTASSIQESFPTKPIEPLPGLSLLRPGNTNLADIAARVVPSVVNV